MKKIIITVALVISALGYSQQRQAESVDLAPFIGIGIANYHSGDTNSNNKSITRATFGATVDFYFNDKWSLRSGLIRSEEHTSELQSRENLVCLLLLEKKKKMTISPI